MGFAELIPTLYSLLVAALSVHGFVFLILSLLFLCLRRKVYPASPPLVWPRVTVQLPIYNERLAVERLIDSVAELDYPREALSVQVLDDSTDETVGLASRRAAHYRARGLDIRHLRRPHPEGHKAGALAAGLQSAPGEFLAVFDADFLPPRDFLRRTIPLFSDPRLGMVQTRWGHLNLEDNALTRAQSIALDGFQVVEHSIRSQLDLLLSFYGSAGVWRKECIQQAGGWQADTLAEDLDLSFRAQLAGWRAAYLPEVVVPAEVPPRILALKRQLFRWTKGGAQVLVKLGGRLLRSDQTPLRKLYGLIYLGQSLSPLLMLAVVLATLPMTLSRQVLNLRLEVLSPAMLGAPLLFGLSQVVTYRDWPRRLAYLPLLAVQMIGLSLNNGWAVLEALFHRNPTLFLRTPKYRRLGKGVGRGIPEYALSVDWKVWGEAALAVYAAATTVAAALLAPGLVWITALYTAGFAWIAWLGLREAWEASRAWHPSQSLIGRSRACKPRTRP